MHQSPNPSDRRHFLAWASAAGAFFAAHGFGMNRRAEAGPSAMNGTAGGVQIRKLELRSSVPLWRMKEFYHQLLDLPVIDESSEQLTFQAGTTQITFLNAQGNKKPFYHFAFNIPENKLLAAYHWQKERTQLLPIPKRLQDSRFPPEVVNYKHWNAHSVFFFDPSGNVVEYIARHDLANAAKGDFDSKGILCTSEIAFVVDDVPAAAAQLKDVAGVEQYKGSSKQFAAVGNEYGLLLAMKRGRVISFNAADKKAANVYATKAVIQGEPSASFALPEFPYTVSVVS